MDIIKYIVKTLIHKPLKNIFTGPSNHYKMCNQTPTCPQMRREVLKPHDIGQTSDRECDETKTTILVHELEIKNFLIEELQKKLVETTQQNKNQLEKWMGLYSTKIREMQQTHKKQLEDLHKTLPKSEKMAPTAATIKEETTTAPASIIILPDKITEENPKPDTVHQHNRAAENKPKLQLKKIDNNNHFQPTYCATEYEHQKMEMDLKKLSPKFRKCINNMIKVIQNRPHRSATLSKELSQPNSTST